MCGLTGYLDSDCHSTHDELSAQVTQMADTLRHRGPDDAGTWVEASIGIALGFRRLSILDLSPTGRQPMHSACGRYVIVFNGEIYNFRSLRKELEALGDVFRGRSDTEVALAAVSRWGLETAVKSFNGMFAFVLWDRRMCQLHLVRDRLGEKPLYYGWMGKTFLFGSELKALRVHPKFVGEVNRDALFLYLRHNCIPTPYSIYKNIYKVPPATILTLNVASKEPDPKLTSYWSVKQVAINAVAKPIGQPVEEAIAQLDTLLRESVKLRMTADVPLGAFLSGGIDSSTVVSMMQAESNTAVKTFSIGFHMDGYNEAVHAKAVADHLGTAHTELYVTPEEAMKVIPKLPLLYDEPFADSSQIPTFLVALLAREQVTVSLSGDGGDELFGGYNRYLWVPNLWKKIKWLPKGIRGTAVTALNIFTPGDWEAIFQKMESSLPSRFNPPNPGDKLQKLAEVLAVDDPKEMYLGLTSHWQDPASLVLGGTEPSSLLTDLKQYQDLPDITHQMMYLDTVTYLPDDILVKLDRASMSVSLEARLPLLDHRLVEFAWQLPLSLKIRNGQGKWVLRQVLDKYIPRELMERPKAGFAIPIHAWLRGPLREWTEALLDEQRLYNEGFFDPTPIRTKWTEHLAGKRNWQHHLWDVLMFQAWLDENKG
jgi:asparagine synthase (glutamine-hydrolysing)